MRSDPSAYKALATQHVIRMAECLLRACPPLQCGISNKYHHILNKLYQVFGLEGVSLSNTIGFCHNTNRFLHSSSRHLLAHPNYPLLLILPRNDLAPHQLLQPRQAVKSLEATLLHTHMQQVCLIMYRHTINMYCPRLIALRYSQPCRQISREHCP
jgi:hypothetical protein